MEILNLEQGSDEWKTERLNNFCASEAPAMMDQSKFMSRNQLLDLKKGWQSNPNSSFKEKLFEKGHESEAAAREIVELQTMDDFPPMVGMIHIDDIETGLLASFDGLREGNQGSYDEGALIWEHKEWNQTLSENVRNGVLEPSHYWQLEQQCLVSGSEEVLFTCSNGTTDKKVDMTYISTPERRAELIAGWKQFEADLKNHVMEAKQEAVVAKVAILPALTWSVNGSEISTNLGDCLEQVREMAQVEISRKLETDQDFANKDQLNKDVKKAREELKRAADEINGKFVDLAAVQKLVADYDEILQKVQSHGEKQVKDAKAAKKADIANKAQDALTEYIASCDERIYPYNLFTIVGNMQPDWAASMKNKRNIESLQNGVDTLLSETKITIDEFRSFIEPNLEYFNNAAKDHKFLFNDIQSIIAYPCESFNAMVDSRITDQKALEKLREDEIEAYLIQGQMNKEAAEEQAKIKAAAQQVRDDEVEAYAIQEQMDLKAAVAVTEPQDEIPLTGFKIAASLGFTPAVNNAGAPEFNHCDMEERPLNELVASGEIIVKEEHGNHSLHPSGQVEPQESQLIDVSKPPEDLLNEVSDWCGRNKISLEESGKLADILGRYFK